MQRLGFLELFEERFELLVLFLSLLLLLLQNLNVRLQLLSMFLPFLFFQTFLEFSLKSLLFCFLHFNRPFFLLHFFLETMKIFIDLLDSFPPFLCSQIFRRHFVIKVINAKFDIKFWLILLFMYFLKIPINNLAKELPHLLISDLNNSFFENSFLELTIINIGKILCLISCIVPVGLLFDILCDCSDDIFQTFRVFVARDDLGEYFGLIGVTMLH